MTDPVIMQRLSAHMRLQVGSAYVYALLDDQGRVIGSFTVTRLRRKGVATETRLYVLGTGPDAREFDTPSALIRAYKQQVADEEWNAAAPKTGGNDGE